LEDWYEVSEEHINRLKGISLLDREQTVMELLSKQYPEYDWKEEKFKVTKKSQRLLFRIVKEIFPMEGEIYMDFLHPRLRHASRQLMELDIYVPRFQLALEYQGSHHFVQSPLFASPSIQQERDLQKAMECQHAGITLIEIPYNWKCDKERQDRNCNFLDY
jgi:hypothetical protein